MGPKSPMDMTWERLFLLSLTEKRRKKLVSKNGRSDPSISCLWEGVSQAEGGRDDILKELH